MPSYRYLLPAQGLDLAEAAALTDAGLTPYRAVKKLVPAIYPGSTVVIIGTGGLGQFGIQYTKLLLPAGTTVVAVDVDNRKLEIARDLGADVVINSRDEDPVQRIKDLTGAEGAQGIVDFVGADATLRQAYYSAWLYSLPENSELWLLIIRMSDCSKPSSYQANYSTN